MVGLWGRRFSVDGAARDGKLSREMIRQRLEDKYDGPASIEIHGNK